ncbi:Hpt domain-containing protein [Rubripirellula reticaptiva]|uniref:Hpt domain-containing protein n=1 Tax=Rubripirellula reticaptiva TaxID=2528013 RepID=UPI001648FF4A|nr:Hpt domain-containing protein [Rubripirellula reticaptiva]
MNKSEELASRFGEAIARLDGDESLLREMAAITAADLPEVIDETDQALQVGDSEQAASGLHKLKGMLSTFETGGVTVEVHEMLEMARRDGVVEAKRSFDRHRSELNDLVAEITAIAAK